MGFMKENTQRHQPTAESNTASPYGKVMWLGLAIVIAVIVASIIFFGLNSVTPEDDTNSSVLVGVTSGDEPEPVLIPRMTMMQRPGTPWNVSFATTDGWYAIGIGLTREYQTDVFTAVCARMVFEVDGQRIDIYDDVRKENPERVFYPEHCPMPGGITAGVTGGLIPIDQLPRVNYVDVIIIPDTSVIRQGETMDKYWNMEIVLKDVPLNWENVDLTNAATPPSSPESSH